MVFLVPATRRKAVAISIQVLRELAPDWAGPGCCSAQWCLSPGRLPPNPVSARPHSSAMGTGHTRAHGLPACALRIGPGRTGGPPDTSPASPSAARRGLSAGLDATAGSRLPRAPWRSSGTCRLLIRAEAAQPPWASQLQPTCRGSCWALPRTPAGQPAQSSSSAVGLQMANANPSLL